MPVEKIGVEIDVKTKKAQTEFAKAKDGLKQFNEELDRNYDGVRALDAVTGGMASTVLDFKDSVFGGIKAMKGFIGSFKTLKTAIIATGIGALVVGVSLLVTYWDDISAFIFGSEESLEDQAETLREIGTELKGQEGVLQKRKKLLELQGEDTTEITEQIKQQRQEQLDNNKLLQDNIKLRMKELELIIEQSGTSRRAARKRSEAIESLAELQKELTAAESQELDIRTSILQTDKEIVDTQKEAAEARKQAVLDAILLEDEMKRFAEESWAQAMGELGDISAMSFIEAFTEKVKEEEFDPNAVLFMDEALLDLEDPETPLGASLAANQRYVDEIARQQGVIDQAKKASFDNVLSITNAETALGKAALIAKQVQNAKELILEAKKTLAFSKSAVANSLTAVAEGTAKTAKIGFPQNIPMLIAYAAQAVGIIGAIKKAAKSSSASAGAATEVAQVAAVRADESQSPAFNIVGGTGTNQIADAIAQGQRTPQRAYVVSGDVSTAQELERKTVQGASLG